MVALVADLPKEQIASAIAGGGRSYTYDCAKRVTNKSRSNKATSLVIGHPKNTTIETATTYFRYDAETRKAKTIVPPNAYTYDAAGRIIPPKMKFEREKHPKTYSATTYRYTYDILGRMAPIQKQAQISVVCTDTKTIITSLFTKCYDGSDAKVQWHNDFHTNHLYSTAALTNSAGAVVERYGYDAYGKRVMMNADGSAKSGNAVTTVGFTGRTLDVETGLWYFRARYYSEGLGRFIGRDPKSYIDGNNLYSGYFVPNQLDPSGNESIFIPFEDLFKDWDLLLNIIKKGGDPDVITQAAAQWALQLLNKEVYGAMAAIDAREGNEAQKQFDERKIFNQFKKDCKKNLKCDDLGDQDISVDGSPHEAGIDMRINADAVLAAGGGGKASYTFRFSGKVKFNLRYLLTVKMMKCSCCDPNDTKYFWIPVGMKNPEIIVTDTSNFTFTNNFNLQGGLGVGVSWGFNGGGELSLDDKVVQTFKFGRPERSSAGGFILLFVNLMYYVFGRRRKYLSIRNK